MSMEKIALGGVSAKPRRQFIDIQRTQFKRLGVLGDWENPYLTLNKEYEADELRMFADIVAKGFVYRGKKPVYWSIPCRTALAEAEVEYADHVSQSVFVKFPCRRPAEKAHSIVIWTTTPWTLPANLRSLTTKISNTSKPRSAMKITLLFRGLLPAVAEKCGWTNYTETQFPTEELAKLEYQHPFLNRTGKLSPPNLSPATPARVSSTSRPVMARTTTISVLKVGLPIYSPVDDDGALALHK